MNCKASLYPVLIIILATICGCSSKNPNEPSELLNKEEKQRLEISLDTPENQLLEDGKKYFNSELYTLARQNFESLRTGYPNSPFVDFAEIKIADCIFEAGSYSEAAKFYEDFTKRRPTHPSNSYMLYRAGISNQLSHTGVGRDPTPLKKAIEIYDQILRDYPNSEYQADVIVKKKQAFESLLAHEQRIQNYYNKKNLDQAAQSRKSVVETTLVPVLSSLQNQIPAEEEQTNEIPEGVTLDELYKNPSSKSVSKSLPQPSAEKAVPETSTSPQPPRLTKVQCQNKEKKSVTLFLSQIYDIDKLPKRILNKDGVILVKLDQVLLPNQIADCFGIEDLTLSSDGSVSLLAFVDAMVSSPDLKSVVLELQ